VMNKDYIVGTFIREEKNRFICTVNVEGKEEECYIPSSCRLENFLELAGKKVLLKENQNKNARTRLTVYALKMKYNYLILKTSEANEIVANAITGRRFAFLGKRSIIEKERSIEGYKSDIFLPETRTIIEIKSIITVGKMAVFPTVYSERAINQLKKVKELLRIGYKVVYIFVSLNPYVRAITLSEEKVQEEYYNLFKSCIEEGMVCKAYTSRLKDGRPILSSEIPLR